MGPVDDLDDTEFVPVPAWEKFEVLVKALVAEKDEDWRSLHRAALLADLQCKGRNGDTKNWATLLRRQTIQVVKN